MKHDKKKLFLLTLFLGFVTFILTSFSLAQSPTANYDVTVSPVFFDLASTPQSTITDKVRIRNNTTSPLALKLGVQRLTGDNNGDLTLREDDNDQSLSWIKFNQDSIVAKPLEWTDVPFTITIPQEAAYGYYYAITFTQDNNSPLTQTGAKITGAAAVPILLNVRKEGAKSEAKILSFSTNSYINEYLPVDFEVKVENVGNVHVRPRGNIFISEGLNKDVAILDVNPGSANVIPDTKKTFITSWTDGFLVKEKIIEDGQVKLAKNGKPVEKIKINWNKLTSFRIGKYTANLLLVFDNGKRDVSLESQVSFWVIPYKFIILMIISLIILTLVIRFLLKSYINREIRERLNK